MNEITIVVIVITIIVSTDKVMLAILYYSQIIYVIRTQPINTVLLGECILKKLYCHVSVMSVWI